MATFVIRIMCKMCEVMCRIAFDIYAFITLQSCYTCNIVNNIVTSYKLNYM